MESLNTSEENKIITDDIGLLDGICTLDEEGTLISHRLFCNSHCRFGDTTTRGICNHWKK